MPESAALWRGGVRGKFGIARADHFYAEENKVGGTGVLDGVEGYGRGGEDGGDAEGCGEDVEESAEECADGRLKAFAAASGEGAGEDVEDAGARSDGEEHGGGQEECEAVRVEHGNESIKGQGCKSTSGVASG